jgi:hypothetical protein
MRKFLSPAVIRRAHALLSLFFTPLLLIFVITGCWQMLVPEEVREEPGAVRQLLDKFSTVHTDGYFPRAGVHDPSTLAFKIVIALMGLALGVTILLGLQLAWKTNARKLWPAAALGLGVVVPAVILWLA